MSFAGYFLVRFLLSLLFFSDRVLGLIKFGFNCLVTTAEFGLIS